MKNIFFLILILLNLNLFAATNNMLKQIKQEKEIQYSMLNNSGIKEIQFNKNFNKIIFNDGVSFCENDNIITDNCTVILNKKNVINNTYSSLLLKYIIKNKYNNLIITNKNIKHKNYFYMIDPYLLENNILNKIKKIKNINIIFIPTNKESISFIKNFYNKNYKIKIKKETLEYILKFYKKYSFDVPITIH